MAIEKEKLIDMYQVMVRIRAFEERVSKEFAMGNIPGHAHLYTGEEAVATGACANLSPDDYIVSTHRGHGHLIAKGGSTDRMMAEIFGKKTGYCKGKGGTMHIADTDIGILGANGIVGAGITIAAGAALSAQKRKSSQVTICFFGDGADGFQGAVSVLFEDGGDEPSRQVLGFDHLEVLLGGEVDDGVALSRLLIDLIGNPVAPEGVEGFALGVLQLGAHLQAVGFDQVEGAQVAVEAGEDA